MNTDVAAAARRVLAVGQTNLSQKLLLCLIGAYIENNESQTN